MVWLVLLGLLWAIDAQAGCSGSGLNWTCSAPSTTADVNSALSGATDGATITFNPGSYTLGGTPSPSSSKAVTLICATTPLANGAATVNPCTINLGGNSFLGTFSFTGTITKAYRVSGFIFEFGGVDPTWGAVYFSNPDFGAAVTMTSIRIDHNTFQNVAADGRCGMEVGSVAANGQFYGVMDHNTWTGANRCRALDYLGSRNVTPPAAQSGTANNLFFEDNVLTFTGSTSSGETCTDGWGGMAVVVRFNTSTNCTWGSHGVTRSGGPANFEFYGNDVTINSGANANDLPCYRCFHHQGSGEITLFNNKLTPSSGHSSAALAVNDYRAVADSPVTTTSIVVSGGTTTVNGNFSTVCGAACTGWWYLSGFSTTCTEGVTVCNNGNFNATSATASSISGPTVHGQTNETVASQAWQASHDRGQPVCDGTVTTSYASFNDGNRSTMTTYRGYPCYRQAGRDFAAVLKPMYAWGNFWSDLGTNVPILLEGFAGTPAWTSEHFQANRDYYNYVTPFTGASGVGVGSLASRPATCTPTSESADAGNGGVGYWATDQGSWRTQTPSMGYWPTGDQGILFRCKSSNTWTTVAESYTPYTYPHPLVTGDTPHDTTPPAAPTGVIISQVTDHE